MNRVWELASNKEMIGGMGARWAIAPWFLAAQALRKRRAASSCKAAVTVDSSSIKPTIADRLIVLIYYAQSL
jgi:hypothetical protein